MIDFEHSCHGVTPAPVGYPMLIRLAVVAMLVAGVAGPAGLRAGQRSAQAADTAVQPAAGSEATDTPAADPQPAADPRTLDDTGASAEATSAARPTLEFGLDRSTEPNQTGRLLLALFGFVLVIAAALFAHQQLMEGRRRNPDLDQGEDRPLPPIVFPARPAVEQAVATAPVAQANPAIRSTSPAEPASAARAPSWASKARPVSTAQSTRADTAGSARRAKETASPRADAMDAGETAVAGETALAGGTATGQAVQSGPIRFHRPPEGTLQLLPGRLQVVSDNERQEEIRFVKVSGEEPAITFGRSEGRPHLHVQLESPTVSRMHATMRYRDGSWYLSNLSGTNPVVVNERELDEVASPQIELADGDRIEMGEVVFRFRSRG